MLSINNKLWIEKDTPNNLIELLMEKHNNSYLTAKILLNRGVLPDNYEDFFNNKLKTSMPNPYILKDMDIAVKLTHDTILLKKNICIIGDYDVDGMCSIALLYKYLSHINCNVTYYLPNRFNEGYGGNVNSITSILENDPDLIIMVDNGSTSHELIRVLRNNNKEVIVIDHHAIEINMPPASAIINPIRIDDNSNLNYLCSAGLVFLFLVVLNRSLLESNFIKNNPSNLLYYLNLVALATVCDMVPLVSLNRTFVKQGLNIFAQENHLGIKCLLEFLHFDGMVTTDTLGFLLGPIINAASRMGNESLALKLLITNNTNDAIRIAASLKDNNIKRQEEEEVIINKAIEQINILNTDDKFIFLGSEQWSQGLVGIIAGRIKELHNKPTCIYSINTQNNTATASGRSIENIDLGNIVMLAKQHNLLIKGGGHSQAVGFTFDINIKEKIFDFFNKHITLQLERKKVQCSLYIDHTLSLSAVNRSLIENLQLLEPYGIGFAEPLFRITSIFISNVKPIGKYKNHLSLDISDGIRKVKGICFKAIPSNLGDCLLNLSQKPVDIIAKIKGNFYKGNIYPNIIIIDIKV